MLKYTLFVTSFFVVVVSVASRCGTGCPFEWTPFGDRCYLIQTIGMTYSAAEQACRSLSTHRKMAHLVSITSRQELDFVEQLVSVAWDNFDPPLSWKEIWIGLRVGSSAETTVWEDGSPVEFYYLHGSLSTSVPYGSTTCTLFTISHNTWKPWGNCNSGLPSVCEMQRD